jgi:enamine deaminase RidA (YjgF/YER057c/UK114 family)
MATYEAIVPDASWPKGYTFSPAVRVGNLIFLSGTTAGDHNGEIVCAGDIAGQTRFIFEKFRIILESVGGSLANIVETTDYYVTLEGYGRTAEVRRDLLRGPPWPAATGVQVAGLIRANALIEIKAIAAL